jgi:hypothetical protein
MKPLCSASRVRQRPVVNALSLKLRDGYLGSDSKNKTTLDQTKVTLHEVEAQWNGGIVVMIESFIGNRRRIHQT